MIPNGVPIGLDELLATRERWTREHLDQRPPWWRPLARLAWRAELEQLEVMPLGEVARRLRRGQYRSPDRCVSETRPARPD